MALKDKHTDERYGFTFNGAYIRLAYFSWSDVTMSCVAVFSVWATPEARTEGKECIENIEIDVSDLFPNIQEQLYNRAKLDPKFAEAIDV